MLYEYGCKMIVLCEAEGRSSSTSFNFIDCLVSSDIAEISKTDVGVEEEEDNVVDAISCYRDLQMVIMPMANAHMFRRFLIAGDCLTYELWTGSLSVPQAFPPHVVPWGQSISGLVRPSCTQAVRVYRTSFLSCARHGRLKERRFGSLLQKRKTKMETP
jgi:hypothetical protein